MASWQPGSIPACCLCCYEISTSLALFILSVAEICNCIKLPSLSFYLLTRLPLGNAAVASCWTSRRRTVHLPGTELGGHLGAAVGAVGREMWVSYNIYLGRDCCCFSICLANFCLILYWRSLLCLFCHRSTENYFSRPGPSNNSAALQSRRLRVRRRWQSHASLQMGPEVSPRPPAPTIRGMHKMKAT